MYKMSSISRVGGGGPKISSGASKAAPRPQAAPSAPKVSAPAMPSGGKGGLINIKA
jgi:hypothetical protein